MITDRALIYAEKEGYRALELDVHRPDGVQERASPVVVQFHGGGWRVSNRQRTPRETRSWSPGFFERLVGAGFVVVAHDYRFSGEALYPAALDDSTDAVRWTVENIAAYGGDPTRIALFGQSAGGYLAAMVGLAGDVGPIGGVACWYPLTDFRSLDQDDPMSFAALFLGGPLGARAELAASASAPLHARPDAPPFLLLHGTADTMAPYEQSLRLRDALVGAGAHADLVTIDSADHFFAGHDDVDGLLAQTIAFLQEVTR